MHPYRSSDQIKSDIHKYRLIRDDLITYHKSYFSAWVTGLLYTFSNPWGMAEIQINRKYK